MQIPQYAEDVYEEDLDREPVRFFPPDGDATWPPVPSWDKRLWTHWLSQHADWPPQRITQYLEIDRYKYGLGLQRHPKEPYTYFYLPVPAAVPMHSSKVPNLCYGGAVGGTKSHSTRFDAYRHLLSIPDYNAILMRRTHEELKRNHTNPALKDCAAINEFFQQNVMDLVPSEHEMRFPLTRGLLTFGHCQNLGDEEKYLGPEYDEFRPDEMATFEKQQIIGVAGRLRSVKHGPYGQVAARLIGTTNPGPHWIKQMFLDKSVPRHENPRYKPDHYLYIPAKLYDNPYLMDEDGSYTTYEDRLFAYSPQRRKQLLDGNWDAVSGQFFPEWDRSLHVGVIPVPWGCKIEVWIDWGYSPHPGVCHWAACLPNGRLYVFAEWIFNGEGRKLLVAAKVAARISEITKQIVKETGTRWNKSLGDPSMWAKDGHTGESYEETFRRNGVRMVRADNDRVQGWGRFRHWLQRHPEGGAWLMYHPDCTYAIRTIPTLVHDKNDPDDCDCWIAGTPVSTPEGQVPIEDVHPGDLVDTPVGPREVLSSYLSGTSRTSWIELDDGRRLEGTPHHKVYVRDKGLVPLSALTPGDVLSEKIVWSRLLNIAVSCIAAIQVAATMSLAWLSSVVAGPVSIVRSGLMPVELFPMAGKSITLTTIRTTTRFPTWFVSQPASIGASTTRWLWPVTLDNGSRRGVALRLERLRSEATHRKCWRARLSLNVRAVIMGLLLVRDTIVGSIVPVTARKWVVDTWNTLVQSAALPVASNTTTRARPRPARIVAVGNCESGKLVYNLTVADAHLFYAGGILSSNTQGEDHAADADRYGVMGRPTRTVYRYKPAPSIPESVAAMIAANNKSKIRPFGRLA